MTNITGTISTGTVATTFTGTTNDPVVAGTPFAGTIVATAPPPVTTIKVGETAVLTAADDGNGNLLVAQPITLTQPAALQSLSFYVTTVGGQLRLGLYSGTKPTTLVAQTAAFTPVAGWNTQPATSAQLPAGQYWLAYFPQSNTLGFVKANTGGTSYYHTQTFGSMPTAFPASPSTTPSHWSFYGTFSTVPVAADTTPPSVPTGTIWTENPGVAINLGWTASSDNVAVTGYNVFRNGAQIATPVTNSYADTGPLTAGTGYTYTVSAFDAAGNTSMPASFSSTVFPTKNIPGQPAGGGTGPVSHGDQLTINNVGPWTLQAVPMGSENLLTVPVPSRGFWEIATPSEYAPTGTYVLNNNPTNRGGVLATSMTIDGYSFPAGTVVCQFSDLSGSGFSCQGQGGSYLFRGCRFRNNLTDDTSSFNDFTSTYTQALHFCDMGGLSAADADADACFWKMIGGTDHHVYRCYMTYQKVALQPNAPNFQCIENYIDKITFFFGLAGPPSGGGPNHTAAIGCEGGVSGYRIMRNRIFIPSPDDGGNVIANGSTVAMEGTNGGTYHDCQVVDNYIAGANYAFLDFGEVAGQTNIVATGNKFTTIWWTNGGLTGIEQAGPFPVPWGSNGNVKSNNTWADDYGTGGTGSGTPLSSRQYPTGNGPRKGTLAM